MARTGYRKTLPWLLIILVYLVYVNFWPREKPNNQVGAVIHQAANQENAALDKVALDAPVLNKVDTKDELEVLEDTTILERMLDLCNSAKKPIVGMEGTLPDSLVSQYQLKSVYAVMRHGDRTPLRASKLAQDSSKEIKFWKSRCHDAVGFQRKKVARYYNGVDDRIQIKSLGDNANVGHPLSHATSVCDYGQLTNAGVEQFLKLGNFFQDIYINHLKLIQEEHLHQQVSFRSTKVRRTQQSAAAFVFHFLSKFDLKRNIVIVAGEDTWFRDSNDQPRAKCGKMNEIWKESKKEKGIIHKLREIESVLDELAPLFNKSRIQIGNIKKIADDFITRVCHETELPCGPKGCLSKHQLAKVIRSLNLVSETEYEPIAPLALYPLLKRIQEDMYKIVTNSSSKVKFSLMVGHDSTIAPLLYSLKIHNEKWPRYAARVVFELWQSTATKSEYFIRVLYDGKVVTSKLEFCTSSDNKVDVSQLCPYNSFKDYMNNNVLIKKYGQNYQKICQG
ncbi:uncharacterized protein TRIADDRAFT_55604 [Trichoplax adhaerens]|uniref:2-phosphoxylose phosphatase 1 n=1 Tax=Trichoplax adhaerens TaxID=10228 RepID=B3RVC5_TRIAD|nr:hypothetical protein TRIADDRAFT_55604 [Trichoplax adhaerens]EDV25478.1 hypothetical protein TRIADDRAFT_55604 [Trichoplax adhaerens]|eukprot:XP_002111511.1 hypothetical protein TRIADDRAFT_55604 [Trichoplax adhaerens]